MTKTRLLMSAGLVLVLLWAGFLYYRSTDEDGDGAPPERPQAPPPPAKDDLLLPVADGERVPVPDPKVQDHHGRFSFHYQQGYSFLSRSVVPPEEADLVFKTCAGGISSVTLEVPGGGITDLRSFRRECDAATPLWILHALRKAKPDELRLSGDAKGKDGAPERNVFLLKSRRGEWVRLAILERVEGGDWTKQLVTVQYDLKMADPDFGEAQDPVEKDGIVLDRSILAGREGGLSREEQQRLAGERERLAREEKATKARGDVMRRRLDDLDRGALTLEEDLRNRGDEKSHISAVLTRGAAEPLGDRDAYTASTFSFSLNSRDDLEKSRNDWDFVLQHWGIPDEPHLWVKTVTDDRSRIRDLGAIGLAAARRGEFPPGVGGAHAKAVEGHVYVIHTLDSDSDHWVLLEILELQSAESMVFRWEIIEDPKKLLSAFVPPEKELRSSVVRIQIRGGAAGGNSRAAYLDGTAEERRTTLVDEPIDMTGEIDIHEKCRSYVEGGYVPADSVYVIRSIEYAARADGDSNGDGSFLLWVGPYRVAEITELRRKPTKADRRAGISHFLLKTIDGGLEEITNEDFPLTRSLLVRIPIRSGREKNVYVKIRNSSYGDVTLRGDLVPADRLDPNPNGVFNATSLHWRLDSVARSETWEHLADAFAELVPGARPWLEAILAFGARGEYRRRIEYILARMQK